MSTDPQPTHKLSNHILSPAATMVGVCMTVISIVKLNQRNGMAGFIDEALAIDSAIFLLSVFLSYLSIRSPRSSARLESFADNAFVAGLALMVVSGFMLTFGVL